MRIACVGGGPGGLYAALLLKKADPSRQVTVIDRNPPNATYGWGVVFSDETMGFLQEADPETYEEITGRFVHWEVIETRYRGEVIQSGGHAFSGIGRHRLLNILQRRCDELGVRLLMETEVGGLEPYADCDLIIAADGVKSEIRAARDQVFRPSFDTHRTKFIWLGARLPLDAFTFIFRDTEYGMFTVHSYPFDPEICTFIVECSEETWKRAGLDRATESESLDFCASVFAQDLQGRELMSNRSSWLNFVTLRNETWHDGNIVLLGDAAHTAHFSVGSGTKMAMEDAIALTEVLDRHPGDLNRALVDYEELRQPLVERTQLAARESSRWFENLDRYSRFEPTQFAFSLLTRSKRITYDNLKLRDPGFSDRVDRWFSSQAARETGARAASFPAPAPAFNPITLRGLTVRNRLVSIAPSVDAATDGIPGDQHLLQMGSAALGGMGLVMTEMVAVSAEGRVTPGTPGLYCPEHRAAWERVVTALRAGSPARLALQLGHAGRRGSTRPRREGVDRPLQEGSWPLLSASPLRYTSHSQAPKEMDRADMDRLRDAFAQAAAWAAEVGFDALEIQAAHGYLLASFISPLTNRRSDRYGGSLENRLRFPLEVTDAVRAVWPEDRPLFVCVAATDWAPGGIGEGESVEIARCLAAHGCDLIDVTTGQTTSNANPTYGRAWQVPFSDRIRNDLNVRTAVGGRLPSLDEVNTILAAGRADLCIVSPLALTAGGWGASPT